MSGSRRSFLRQIGVAGTSGLTAVNAGETSETRTVSYKINGFTCETCALGLEVLLRRQVGITRAKASYPERQVAITFNADLTNEESIRKVIEETGFTVGAEPRH